MALPRRRLSRLSHTRRRTRNFVSVLGGRLFLIIFILGSIGNGEACNVGDEVLAYRREVRDECTSTDLSCWHPGKIVAVRMSRRLVEVMWKWGDAHVFGYLDPFHVALHVQNCTLGKCSASQRTLDPDIRERCAPSLNLTDADAVEAVAKFLSEFTENNCEKNRPPHSEYEEDPQDPETFKGWDHCSWDVEASTECDRFLVNDPHDVWLHKGTRRLSSFGYELCTNLLQPTRGKKCQFIAYGGGDTRAAASFERILADGIYPRFSYNSALQHTLHAPLILPACQGYLVDIQPLQNLHESTRTHPNLTILQRRAPIIRPILQARPVTGPEISLPDLPVSSPLDLMREFSIDQVSVLKMHCEGCEFELWKVADEDPSFWHRVSQLTLGIHLKPSHLRGMPELLGLGRLLLQLKAYGWKMYNAHVLRCENPHRCDHMQVEDCAVELQRMGFTCGVSHFHGRHINLSFRK